jgi:uncharacterized protein (TIGR00369 family)
MQRKTITWHPPEASRRDTAALTGLEYLQALKDGRVARPPAAVLVGYRIAALAVGRVCYELVPEEAHYNPFATVHGGILATLMDSALTAAVISTLPRGRSCSTAEIKVNFLRPVTAETGRLVCEAQLVHAGRRLAAAEGKVRDHQGRLCAMGICSCLLFDTDGPSPTARR